jgi:hypothetical protein
MEGGIEKRADDWTDMEMQTVTFGTLQTLLKMLIFQFLINFTQYEIRICLEEQQMASEHFTHFHKFVHRFNIMQHLIRSAICNCLNSKFVGITR